MAVDWWDEKAKAFWKKLLKRLLPTLNFDKRNGLRHLWNFNTLLSIIIQNLFSLNYFAFLLQRKTFKKEIGFFFSQKIILNHGLKIIFFSQSKTKYMFWKEKFSSLTKTKQVFMKFRDSSRRKKLCESDLPERRNWKIFPENSFFRTKLKRTV